MKQHNNLIQKKKNAQTVSANAIAKNHAQPLQDNRPATVVQKKKLNGLKEKPVQIKASVVQRADDGGDLEPNRSLRNLAAYSADTVRRYGEDTIRRVLLASGLTVRGHHSGASGSGMNDATRQDIAAVVAALREDAGAHEEVEQVERKGGGGGGKQHTEEQRREFAAQKEKRKKDKKAAGKQFFNNSKKPGGGRGGFGGGRGGRGGGGIGVR